MIVIIKSGQAELITAPQCPRKAWELADQLTEQTGIDHWVGRI